VEDADRLLERERRCPDAFRREALSPEPVVATKGYVYSSECRPSGDELGFLRNRSANRVLRRPEGQRSCVQEDGKPAATASPCSASYRDALDRSDSRGRMIEAHPCAPGRRNTQKRGGAGGTGHSGLTCFEHLLDPSDARCDGPSRLMEAAPGLRQRRRRPFQRPVPRCTEFEADVA
jgi:hypothetical protein